MGGSAQGHECCLPAKKEEEEALQGWPKATLKVAQKPS